MAADVVVRANVAVCVARHDKTLARDLGEKEVARALHALDASDAQPVAPENALALAVEHRGIR